MREIRTSGLMSGEGKRVAQAIPRLSSTLLALSFSALLCVKILLTCLLKPGQMRLP
jgi:sorbitol-specific phosphotransferase system component IIBC